MILVSYLLDKLPLSISPSITHKEKKLKLGLITYLFGSRAESKASSHSRRKGRKKEVYSLTVSKARSPNGIALVVVRNVPPGHTRVYESLGQPFEAQARLKTSLLLFWFFKAQFLCVALVALELTL